MRDDADSAFRHAGAAAAFQALPEDVRRWLDHDNGDGRLLTNHPDLVVALALKKNGFTKLSLSEAEAEPTALRGQKLDALGLAKKKMLAYIAASGKSRDAKLPRAKPANMAPSARAKLEAEAKTLRLDRGYWDKSAPNHKALLSRMADVMKQLADEVASRLRTAFPSCSCPAPPLKGGPDHADQQRASATRATVAHKRCSVPCASNGVGRAR